jgi:hypothetical protein
MSTPNLILAALPAAGATQGAGAATAADARKLVLASPTGVINPVLLPRLSTARAGAAFHVDCENGSDSDGNGSYSAPFATPQKAVDSAAPDSESLVLLLDPPTDPNHHFQGFTLRPGIFNLVLEGAHPNLARVSGAITVPYTQSGPTVFVELRATRVSVLTVAHGSTCVSVLLLGGAAVDALSAPEGAGTRTYQRDYFSSVASHTNFEQKALPEAGAVGYVPSSAALSDWSASNPPSDVSGALDALASRMSTQTSSHMALSERVSDAEATLAATSAAAAGLLSDVAGLQVKVPLEYSDALIAVQSLQTSLTVANNNINLLRRALSSLASNTNATLTVFATAVSTAGDKNRSQDTRIAMLEAGLLALDNEYRAHKVFITGAVDTLTAGVAGLSDALGALSEVSDASASSLTSLTATVSGAVSAQLSALNDFKSVLLDSTLPGMQAATEAVNQKIVGVSPAGVDARLAQTNANLANANSAASALAATVSGLGARTAAVESRADSLASSVSGLTAAGAAANVRLSAAEATVELLDTSVLNNPTGLKYAVPALSASVDDRFAADGAKLSRLNLHTGLDNTTGAVVLGTNSLLGRMQVVETVYVPKINDVIVKYNAHAHGILSTKTPLNKTTDYPVTTFDGYIL